MGSSELIPFFALLAFVAVAFPIKLFVSQPTSFLLFTLLILSPVLLVGEQVSDCVGLGCWLGLNHDTLLLACIHIWIC